MAEDEKTQQRKMNYNYRNCSLLDSNDLYTREPHTFKVFHATNMAGGKPCGTGDSIQIKTELDSNSHLVTVV